MVQLFRLFLLMLAALASTARQLSSLKLLQSSNYTLDSQEELPYSDKSFRLSQSDKYDGQPPPSWVDPKDLDRNKPFT